MKKTIEMIEMAISIFAIVFGLAAKLLKIFKSKITYCLKKNNIGSIKTIEIEVF